MLKTMLVGALAVLALGQTAAAQTPAAPAQAAPAAAPAVGDQDLKAFAHILLDIEKLRTAPGGLTQPAMLEAVQKSGLDAAKFNEMSTRMRNDTAFNQAVQAAVRELQAAAAPATPVAPATGG